MEALIMNFATSEALADYLMETCSGDVLEFWLDVEFFKRLQDPNEVRTTAKRIYATYLMPTAPKEVVLDPLLKHSLVRLMSSKQEPEYHVDMFNGAQHVVGDVLASRCKATSKSTSSLPPSGPKSRFTFTRQNTFPRQLSSKLKQYNQTITREKSLINFDVL